MNLDRAAEDLAGLLIALVFACTYWIGVLDGMQVARGSHPTSDTLQSELARCEATATRAVRYAESVQSTVHLWLAPKPSPRPEPETWEIEP